MKIVKWVMPLFLVVAALTSCIQPEPENAEADILEVILPDDILKMDPRIENDYITLMLKANVNITAIAPEFVLTPGATIDPPSGTVLNFTAPQQYVVTSEDKKWKKTYTISCTQDGINTIYNFEHFELRRDKYFVFYEVLPNDQKQFIWASGNAGFAAVSFGASKYSYPTTPYEYGKSGNCLKCETRSTGSMGLSVGMPIAAGNLFIGEFDGMTAVTNPLKSTRFGVPFDFIPIRLKGYYKYKAGEIFTDKQNNPLPGRHDTFDIYSILYETDENVKYLDGTNFLTSPNLIAIARMGADEKKETEEWTFFNLPFEVRPGKVIEEQKLKDGKYNVSIVFSSSIDGNLFEGAVGSTLLIDEVELVHDTNIEESK